MVDLVPIAGTDLTELGIQLLNNNNILTPIDFINAEDGLLSEILQISEQKVPTLKINVIKFHAPKPFTLGHRLRTRIERYQTYKTGISGLDALLEKKGDQFCSGCIWDITGTEKIAKAKLISTLATNFAKQIDGLTLIINTSRSHSKDGSTRDVDDINPLTITLNEVVNSVEFIYPQSADELIELFQKLVNPLPEWKDLKLVVIDSLPVFWFKYKPKTPVPCKLLMAILASLMRKVIAEQDVSFVVGDLGSISSDEDSDSDGAPSYSMKQNLEDVPQLGEEVQSRNLSDDNKADNTDVPMSQDTQQDPSTGGYVCFEDTAICNFTERTCGCPVINLYWSTVPRLRLKLEPYSDGDDNSDEDITDITEDARSLRILKSSYTAAKACCTVHMSSEGVV